MFSFTPNTSTFAVLVFFFTLLPFTSTSFVTILSFSLLPYSTSYVISISFPFSNNGILNLIFPCISTLIFLSDTFIVSLIYFASPFNISSIVISLAS